MSCMVDLLGDSKFVTRQSKTKFVATEQQEMSQSYGCWKRRSSLPMHGYGGMGRC